MKPDEFGKLTPGEFYDLLDGYKWRVEREDQRAAWMLANLMNAHLLKKPVSVKKVLQALTGKGPQSKTVLDPKAEWAALRKLFPEKRG